MAIMRKPTQKENMDDLKAEVDLRNASMSRLIQKLNLEGYLTNDERELFKEHKKFVEKSQKAIHAFYAPAAI